MTARMKTTPKCLTIAGSDSGAGAGIQADLKTFAANGVYGTSALTAITAQNTTGVQDILELPVTLIENQIDSVLTDIGTDAVKTGMLSSSEIIRSVVGKLSQYQIENVVVDPVMVAKGGDTLLQDEAIEALKTELIPIALVVTPNGPEATAITGINVVDVNSAKAAAVKLVEMGCKTAVVKGGHINEGPATDIFYDGTSFHLFTTKRVNTLNTHGTGCTFASAIAAGIAKGLSTRNSVSEAKAFVTGSIRHDLQIGNGHGPLNHFYEHWKSEELGIH